MTLNIDCEWETAPGVRSPELRATWAQLRITVGDEIVTLVKEHEAPTQVRERIDVAVCPLAEWLALNWWNLEATSHRPEDAGVTLTGAGEGFPWPMMTLRSDRQQMWVEATTRRDPLSRVDLLGSALAVLDVGEAQRTLSRFVDTTVRRLEDAGISGTLLQDEWSAIQGASEDERQFALVAASWGFDPYDIDEEDAQVLMSAAKNLGDDALLSDLARAVSFSALQSAGQWVRRAMETAASMGPTRRHLVPSFEPLRNVTGRSPWREGYRRADWLREQLDLPPTDTVPIHDIVELSKASYTAPGNIEALATFDSHSTRAIIGSNIDPSTPRGRFIGARALARRITDPGTHASLLTSGTRYSDKLERAFAAEFLAPAVGLNELLAGDFSEESQARAAKLYEVGQLVIAHQIENQLLTLSLACFAS